MTARRLLDDCFLHDRDRMRHDDAVALLRERVAPITGTETLALTKAIGRVLSSDVVAPRPIPVHANAAVDGYGFSFESYDADAGTTFAVSARAAAGHPVSTPVPAGSAARIFTGAALPPGVDSVVMQEDVTVSGDHVQVPAGLKAGANCRMDGEDVRTGEVMYTAGHRVRAQDVAALASTGMASVDVFEPLRVAIISTGDEVRPVGTDLDYGNVFDANGPMLEALCRPLGVTCTALGILKDDEATVRDTLQRAARDHDVVITSGGASRGEEDYVVKVLDEIGKRHFWQIAVKPGRPMSFGQIGDTVFLGFPGNPVAVFVCFLLYGYPMLARLGGANWPAVERFRVPAAFDVPRKKTDRREFWRGTLVVRDGVTQVEKFMRDGAGLISSLRAADALIDVGEDVSSVTRGDLVDVIPLSQFS